MTLESIEDHHCPSPWKNLDLKCAGAALEEHLPGDRTIDLDMLRGNLEVLRRRGSTCFAVKANLAYLNPREEASGSLVNSMAEREHNEVLGIRFYGIRPHDRVIEVGMTLSRPMHRTAASTEAHYLWLLNVCEPGSPGLRASNSPPYRKVVWRCSHLNKASQACAERVGYKLEGILRHDEIFERRSRDTHVYGFIDEEWPAIRDALRLWLQDENFDECGRQRRRLQDIRASLC